MNTPAYAQFEHVLNVVGRNNEWNLCQGRQKCAHNYKKNLECKIQLSL